MLDYPELPLHNNRAELAARTIVQRCNISYGTQTTERTASWDTFISLVPTNRKLGLSFFLDMYAIAFPRLEMFLPWQLLFTFAERGVSPIALLLIPLVDLSNSNNCLPPSYYSFNYK
ncbi:MAG: hypothetical protein MGF17_11910 [Trichodesmium sp. MAG_R04]|nr:hypothetical protein [Trichodesmium sp. MAG_R04]